MNPQQIYLWDQCSRKRILRLFTRQLTSLLLLVLSFTSLAQSPLGSLQNPTLEPLPYGKRVKLSSKFLSGEQLLDVYLPKDFEKDSNTTRYPLIVTLDGWVLSRTVSGIASHLMNTAALPNSVIIALHGDAFSMLPRAYVHSTDNWPAESSTGLVNIFRNNAPHAAEPFWQFLQHELIPFVEKNYRTNHFRTFVGMSPTAYMGIHTLLKGPDLFDAYIFIAAMDVLGLGYSQERDFVDEIVEAAAKGVLDNKFLYVASAEFEARREPLHYANQNKLIEGLSPFSDTVSFKAEHIDDFGHYPVAIPALTNAFNLIFPRQDFQQFQRFFSGSRNTMNALTAHYNKLSSRYGVNINVQTDLPRNPNSLRSIGQKFLNKREFEQAEQVFNLWISISDKNPHAYFWLSRVLADKGELQDAISKIELAIHLAAIYDPNSTQFFKDVLAQYRVKS